MKTKDKSFKLKKKERQFLTKAFIICAVIAFITINILRVIYHSKSVEDLGTTFNGILGTYFGFFASVLVFMALRSQIKANKIISNQFKIQQFESQFYEMLKLHKENINEIEIETLDFHIKYYIVVVGGNTYESKNIMVRGRDCFIYLTNELEISFNIYKDFLKNNKDYSFDFIVPYGIFFNGLEEIKDEKIKEFYFSNKEEFERKHLIDYNPELFCNTKVKSYYKLFEGHENKLGHYYRHLFHTVKFVAEQKNSFIPYREKRKYLRLLRAQLSNFEQGMLFYNYLAYAREWEDENKFLTNYRMIHNLYESVLINDNYFYNEMLNLKNKQEEAYCYKDNDHIFESQRSENIDYICKNYPKD